MKKIIAFALCALMMATCLLMTGCNQDTIIVQTNAYFAPFEYMDGGKIIGVDVEIMNLVGEKLGKKVEFQNVDFDIIIDNVSAGKICDAGAAGITVTDTRKEKVDFSNTYFTSVQYVIYKKGTMTPDGKDGDVSYILWDSLAGKKIGVQRNTTGDIYVDGEINAQEDNDYGYNGVLYGTNTELTQYDNAQVAADAIKANQIDVVVVDKLPASFIVEKSGDYECAALYYKGGEGEADVPTEESYAICVTKGNDELLKAINEVLAELGEEGVEKLIRKHMGIEE
ncbi:MAG: transporter substrate-binding domain-containing protein [Ruminococcaceae bacterium]|nr:transporter substrate-binding domain-containing protein [Oscillospiraceae bacterium]